MKDLKIKETLEHLDKLMDQCRYHSDLVTKIDYFQLQYLKNQLIEIERILGD